MRKDVTCQDDAHADHNKSRRLAIFVNDIASQGTVVFSPPMPPISSLLSQISESLSSSPSNLEDSEDDDVLFD